MLSALVTGCTTLGEFIQNGLKVGPQYERPPAPIADQWIDSGNPRIKNEVGDYSSWWTVFSDPILNNLVQTAYEQNINLRIAATRVLEAQAQRAIATGSLFPQQQQSTTNLQYIKTRTDRVTDFRTGFNATWELDFWGRFRRLIESADDILESSVDDYDNVMVTLIGDVAATYVQYRILEQQIAYTRQNVELQRGSLKIATERWQAGQTNELGVLQGKSLLEQIEATIPLLEIGLRQANNQLCVLLGIPPAELANRLGQASIPQSPAEVVVGIPADLIRRRPDVRAAERLVAAQNAQIGVAEAAFYPAFFISGNIEYQALKISPNAFERFQNGNIGPTVQWDILNYGRILNNVRFQDLKTQELAGVYQQKVLSAAQEVENGIIAFLNARREVEHLAESVKAAESAVRIANAQYRAGAIDYTPVFVAQQFLVQQQNLYAQAQGDIALGLIGVYRAIGGGWELRLAQPNREIAVPLPPAELVPPPIRPAN